MRREGYKSDLSGKDITKARVTLQKERREKFAMAKRYRESNVQDEGEVGMDLGPSVSIFVNGKAPLASRLEALSCIRRKVCSLEGEAVISFLLSPPSTFLPMLMQMIESGGMSEREEALWCLSDLATGNLEQTTFLWTRTSTLLHILSSHNTEHLIALIWTCK
jgi:hypothetical protein